MTQVYSIKIVYSQQICFLFGLYILLKNTSPHEPQGDMLVSLGRGVGAPCSPALVEEDPEEVEGCPRAGRSVPADAYWSGSVVRHVESQHLVPPFAQVRVRVVRPQVEEDQSSRIDLLGFGDRLDDVLRRVDRRHELAGATHPREDALVVVDHVPDTTSPAVMGRAAICVESFFQGSTFVPFCLCRRPETLAFIFGHVKLIRWRI